MTATRVIDDHNELANVGTTTHQQLDNYINNSPLVTVNGASGPVPPSSRALRAGAGISIGDSGPGGFVTVTNTGGGGGGSTTIWMEVPTGTIDGANKTFSLSVSPSPTSTLMLFVNGVLLTQGAGADYTLSGTTITLTIAPRVNSNLAATYTFAAATSTAYMEVPSGTINGSNVTFTLASAPAPSSSLMLFVNGVLQTQGVGADYTLSGTTITFAIPPRTNSNLAATYPF